MHVWCLSIQVSNGVPLSLHECAHLCYAQKITMTHIYRKQIIQVFQGGGHVFLTCDTVNH